MGGWEVNHEVVDGCRTGFSPELVVPDVRRHLKTQLKCVDVYSIATNNRSTVYAG